MGLSHLVIIYYSRTPRINDQTNLSDVKSKLESQYSSDLDIATRWRVQFALHTQ